MPALSSHRLDAHECEKHHPQQHEAVPEPGDLRLAIGAARIADRDLDGFQAELRGAEDEVEIAEGIELPEIAAAALEAQIVAAAYRLGPAQRVGEALRQEPAEQQ